MMVQYKPDEVSTQSRLTGEGVDEKCPRYMVYDRHVRHATGSRILGLIEKMVCGDMLFISKEDGKGYRVRVEEADEPLPRKENEG